MFTKKTTKTNNPKIITKIITKITTTDMCLAHIRDDRGEKVIVYMNFRLKHSHAILIYGTTRPSNITNTLFIANGKSIYQALAIFKINLIVFRKRGNIEFCIDQNSS